MRVRAKKRKIVPILISIPVQYERPADAFLAGKQARKRIEEELGRKAFEFCEIKVQRNNVTLRASIVDRGRK